MVSVRTESRYANQRIFRRQNVFAARRLRRHETRAWQNNNNYYSFQTCVHARQGPTTPVQ